MVRLATLLGLRNPTTLTDKGSTYGVKQMEINGGVKFLNIHCYSYYNGHKSGVIASLEVPTSIRLKGTTKSYFPECTCSPLHEVIHKVVFTVMDQDGKPVDVGKVLLKCYMSRETTENKPLYYR